MSSSKKKVKKGRKGRGGRNKGGGGPSGGGGFSREEIDDGIVEVIFVEDLMHFLKVLPSENEVISPAFLDDVLAECHLRWHLYLPGLQAGDLTAEAVPKFPRIGSTFKDWHGVILVELNEEKSGFGMLNQVQNWKASNVETDIKYEAVLDVIDKKVKDATNEWRDTTNDLRVANNALKMELQEARKETNKECDELRRLLKENERVLKENERVLKENERVIAKVQSEGALAIEELRKEVLFSNQVKRRVILEKARKKIIGSLNKTFHLGEKWVDFFESFGFDDWRQIFGHEEDGDKIKKVKRLLSIGSIAANKNIHEIEAEDIMSSVLAVEVGHDQAAWLWLFNYVFH